MINTPLPTTKKTLGKKGEELVRTYLEQQGFTIKQLNYACRAGEIDIIAEKADVRAFVEVKLRQSHYFALSEVVTPSKQRKIITTACLYNSQQKNISSYVYRFDVALVEHNGYDYDITYIPNAFTQGPQW